MKKTLFFGLSVLTICGAATAVLAAQPRMLQTYGAWDAYVYNEDGGGKVCYIAAKPEKDEGNYKNRGDIHVLITDRPSENTKDVFSYISGYTYKPGSDAKLKIDAQEFVLFTKDDTAWAPSAEVDAKIAQAIRTGSSMVVSGTSSKGTSTKDTYSLAGSSAAYDRVKKECY